MLKKEKKNIEIYFRKDPHKNKGFFFWVLDGNSFASIGFVKLKNLSKKLAKKQNCFSRRGKKQIEKQRTITSRKVIYLKQKYLLGEYALPFFISLPLLYGNNNYLDDNNSCRKQFYKKCATCTVLLKKREYNRF